MINQQEPQWFENWFASPYYHVLYKDRNDDEAQLFLDNLLQYLSPAPNSLIHDAACGKGRHSIYLNKKGFEVIGSDLSQPSINEALPFEKKQLKFFTHDMRDNFKINQFDYVFNLFTSFGYFDDENDNIKVLKAFHKSLKDNGVLVIDFMNAQKVINNIVNAETKIVDGISFNLQRSVKKGHIIKEIQFSDKNQSYSFFEKVQALTLDKFLTFLDQANFELLDTFGDYHLNSFNLNTSDRLILIAKKKQ